MSSPPILQTHALSKTFTVRHGFGESATVEAVRGVDLTVKAEEIFGFLGPNGAGKTTTLRMLTTLLAPTAGRLRWSVTICIATPNRFGSKSGM